MKVLENNARYAKVLLNTSFGLFQLGQMKIDAESKRHHRVHERDGRSEELTTTPLETEMTVFNNPQIASRLLTNAVPKTVSIRLGQKLITHARNESIYEVVTKTK